MKMQKNNLMKNNDTPINMIILENIEQQTEDLIDCYYELIKECKTSNGVKEALRYFCSEQRKLTLREILVKDIQAKAQVLQDTINL
jgi:hypothetical protein